MYIDKPPKGWRQIGSDVLDEYLMICDDYYRDGFGEWDRYHFVHNGKMFAAVQVKEQKVYADPEMLKPMEEEP